MADVANARAYATLSNATLAWDTLSGRPGFNKVPRVFGTSKYKPSTKLDTFRGDSGPNARVRYVDWLYRVETLCQTFDEDVVRQAIVGSVAGTPAQLLRALGPDATTDEMLDELDQAYGDVYAFDTLATQMYSIAQRETEAINDYLTRINNAFTDIMIAYPTAWAPEVAAIHRRDRFFHGLRPTIRSQLRNKYEDGKCTYNSLVRAARQIEAENQARIHARGPPAQLKSKAATVTTPPETDPSGSSPDETEEMLRAKVANLESRFRRMERGSRGRSPSRSRSQTRMSPEERDRFITKHMPCCNGRGCFHCGGCDHFASECPKRDQPSGNAVPAAGSGAPVPATQPTA